MTTTDLVDRLAKHKTLAGAPREELAWLASHGTLRQLTAGEVVTPKGEAVRGMYVVLSGHIALFADRGGGLNKIAEWRDGDVTGLLPYSRLVRPPGDSIAQESSEILVIPKDELRALILECHEITTILVHRLVDRTRSFTSNELHDEKMASLGKLSAGLAHELNNPASAIERGAKLLGERLAESEQAARVLGAARLSDTQFASVDTARQACIGARVQGVRSPIEEAEREESIADWLGEHGLDVALAEELAETAVTFEALDKLAGSVDGATLGAVLRWAAAGCSVRGLASEIQEAAGRIVGLVAAIKGFTHMDQGAAAGPVDLPQGLSNTVAVLKSKARAKSIAVVVDMEAGLPRALGFAGELNQIWLNLIDNALDAVPDGGRVEVLAKCERQPQRIVVRVVDNGPGIPEQIRERIFDPFFTTKAVGSGTGLGLDIVRRLIAHNDAEIAVESKPGRTEFSVALPIARSDGERGQT
jgi:signal transduction histidine kinase